VSVILKKLIDVDKIMRVGGGDPSCLYVTANEVTGNTTTNNAI